MRQLSDRATLYLESLTRSKDAIVDRQQIDMYFHHQNVPIFQPVIDYAVSYSGFTFNSSKKRDSFTSFLVSADDIRLDRKFEIEKFGEQFLFYCGHHETAQFYFYIDQEGRFCSDGYTGANILSSSFELQVEIYAYKNEIAEWVEHPYYYDLKNPHHLQTILSSGFDTLVDCTDNYNGWFFNDKFVIRKGVWLHDSSSYLHFYGKSESSLEKLVADFKLNGVIPSE